MIFDAVTKETGLLVMRFDVMAAYNSPITERPVWAWDILWAGSVVLDVGGRRTAYTEEGLINMIRNGIFIHYKNI